MKNPDFYNVLSRDYDSMLNFDTALQKRSAVLNKFIGKDFRNAADIGCGTGLDSISLAMHGLHVTAFDTSDDMISKARLNASKRNLIVKFINAPFTSRTAGNGEKYDIILSLGNAFANIKEKELINIIKLSGKHLNKNGIFLFQVLNYDLIRKENKRIVNITGKDGNMFVRFYDFVGKNITFNILSFKSDNTTEHKLISTTLYGYNRKFFAEHLKSAGFTKIKYMGDFAGTPFSVKSSKDLIVLAVK